MLDEWIIQALALVGCLMGAALVAMIETALIAVSETRAQAAVDRNGKSATHLMYWVEHAGPVLATLKLLWAFFALGAGVWGLLLATRLPFAIPVFAVPAAVAVLLLMGGIVLPRMVGKRFSLALAMGSIRSVRWLTLVMSPLLWPLGLLQRLLARWVGVPADWVSGFWTAAELRRLSTDHSDALTEQHEQLLDSIFEFSDTIIREIMVPRTEMIAMPVTTPADTLRQTIVEAGHSRIPLYEDTIDNIVGVLHVKDLFPTALVQGRDFAAAELDLRKLARPTFYVPEVMKISELLREFQRRKTHMAIVVDEYGGTAGVVTLEDIIEEIVGEIQDEYDVEEKQFRVLGDDKIIADGRVSVWDLEETLDVKFPDDAGFETLAGFLMHRAGYLPRAGTVITWNDLRFTIKEANEKRIGTVEIERRNGAGRQSSARA